MTAAPLAAFLARAAATPFVWGGFDCCLWLADWIAANTGVDPAAAWRGIYHDPRAARRILLQRSGMVRHLGLILRDAGIERTMTPGRGDVGVLLEPVTPTRSAHLGAICTGPRWAMLTEGGIVSRPATPVAAWAVIRPPALGALSARPALHVESATGSG